MKFIDDEQVIEIIKGVFMVKREYLMITLDKIKESYSSYVEYIINDLGVSEKKLEIFREKYLA
ncbi:MULTISPECIES: tyrosine-protein phosphatase [Terrisporobacter]|uniref:tyrosine-protein phosphatase n=1 Tax=Terrisporobacter TaxID=1505652 RepID=UPI002A7494E8|nr:tyrosine-protein phosphatase [Terrisporobacter othiniensis]MDY3373658.1 tyrosine-protein phosphatase [Terrisporobacter othiniensis]